MIQTREPLLYDSIEILLVKAGKKWNFYSQIIMKGCVTYRVIMCKKWDTIKASFEPKRS